MSLTPAVSIYVSGTWSDITSDVLSSGGLSFEGGMRTNKPTDRIASPSRLTFSLKNNDGKYTPGVTGALTDWGKGTKVKVEFSKNLISEVRFIGYVDSVKISISNLNVTAEVVASSWMRYAAEQPINNPPLQTNKRADQAMTEIVSVMPIQPEATSYATGTNTFPYIFHDANIKTRAYTEFTKIALSEWGYIYDKADGTLVLESSTSRNTPVQKQVTYYIERSGAILKADGGYILKSDGGKILLSQYSTNHAAAEIADTFTAVDVAYGEHIINRATLSAYPYRTGEEEILIYELDNPRTVAAGQVTSFTVQFIDDTGRQISALPPETDTQITLLHLDSIDINDEAGLNIWVNNGVDFVPGAGVFSGAMFFDGSGSYLNASSTANKFNLINFDFTIEWWEFRTDEAVGCAPISRGVTGTYVPFALGVSDLTSARVYMTSNGSSWDIANGKTLGTMIFDEWVHYAVTRSGSTFRTFQNGVLQDSWTSSASFHLTNDLMSIGRYNGKDFFGFLCEVRIIKNQALYTAAFDVPTKPFELTGSQYMVWTGANTTGSDLTRLVDMTISAGGAGVNINMDNISGYDGILWPLKIHAIPVIPGTQETYTAEDAASVLDYGYQQESIEMRYQQDVDFGTSIVDDLITAEKDPRVVLNSITTNTGKSELIETLFLQVDIGDVVSIVESNIEKDALFFVQGISWNTYPTVNGVGVNYKWILKEV